MPVDPAVAPNRLPWPPLLYGGALVAGAVLEVLLPTSVPLPAALGWAIAVVGAGFDVAAMATMWRARTNILPHRAADSLVTGGPFALSRNPIYLGNTLVLLGLALAFDSLWLAAGALAAAALTHRLAILREEEHLEARFGDAWRRYRAAVPRWIGPPRRRT